MSKRKRGHRPLEDLTLLIITDEKDSSSRRDHTTIKKHTSQHFARFIKLLIQPDLPKTILVKNIGDSLMIRVQTKRSPDSILNLLNAILDAQKDLRNGRERIDIRALVALLSDNKHQPLEGNSISSYLQSVLRRTVDKRERERVLPPKLPGKQTIPRWLKGDLFGTPVARAFRASSIPKECDLVVESSVAKLVNNRLSPNGGTISNLEFGPNVAFSPINGLDDLYDIGRPQLNAKGNLEPDESKEHIWLRTVNLANNSAPHCNVSKDREESIAVDALIRRQQQARVLTELVMLRDKQHSEKATHFWQSALSAIENKADYFRFIGRPLLAGTWINGPNGTPVEEDTPLAHLVVLGAYPEFDTYFNVREAILELRKECVNKPDKALKFAQTTMLWSPRARELRARNYWRRLNPGEIFILLMGRAKDGDRTDDPSLSGTPWVKVLHELRFYPSIVPDMGAVMGEWDYYAIYDINRSANPTKKKLNEIKEKCLKEILPKIDRLRFYVCKVPEIKNV